jgi:hypothetical protein
MIRLSIVILIWLSGLSCGRISSDKHVHSGEVVRSEKLIKLVLSDTLTIPVDSVTLSQHYYHQLVHSDSSTFYVIFNASRHTLDFFSLDRRAKAFEITFQAEGPHGIGQPDRFYYHNSDSIFFIYSNNIKRLILCNSLGIKKQTWQIELPEPYSDYWISNELFYEFSYDPLNKSVRFWISDGEVNTLSYQKSILQCQYNIQSNSCTLFGVLPDEFKKFNYYPNNFINSYTSGKNFISWFFPLHDVHVYDRTSNSLLRVLYVKSNYMPAHVEPMKKGETNDADIQEEANYNLQTAFYVKQFTNETASLHYRIVKLGVPLQYSNDRRRHFHDKPFVIMLLDEDLALINEVEFPGGVYDFFQSFAWGNKLYVSLNNPLNPYSKDDFMQFAEFEIR